MDQFQVYRAGVDAVVFLLSHKDVLCLTREVVLSLGEAFEQVSEQMSNVVFNLTDTRKDEAR